MDCQQFANCSLDVFRIPPPPSALHTSGAWGQHTRLPAAAACFFLAVDCCSGWDLDRSESSSLWGLIPSRFTEWPRCTVVHISHMIKLSWQAVNPIHLTQNYHWR
jgi:hypothetical protein